LVSKIVTLCCQSTPDRKYDVAHSISTDIKIKSTATKKLVKVRAAVWKRWPILIKKNKPNMTRNRKYIMRKTYNGIVTIFL
jgi:hypothetical protein